MQGEGTVFLGLPPRLIGIHSEEITDGVQHCFLFSTTKREYEILLSILPSLILQSYVQSSILLHDRQHSIQNS